MSPELSPELREAVHQLPGNQPLRVVDPETNIVYVLVRAELFDQVQGTLPEAHDELVETYAAQSEAAQRAGWDAAGMDDYDHYDQHRQKPCP